MFSHLCSSVLSGCNLTKHHLFQLWELIDQLQAQWLWNNCLSAETNKIELHTSYSAYRKQQDPFLFWNDNMKAALDIYMVSVHFMVSVLGPGTSWRSLGSCRCTGGCARRCGGWAGRRRSAPTPSRYPPPIGCHLRHYGRLRPTSCTLAYIWGDVMYHGLRK